jgi:RNA polymerase sigma factor (sigma-70 family)
VNDADIERVVNRTILKLKLAGLMKDDSKSPFEKTEEILRNYNTLILSDQPQTKKLLIKCNEALQTIDKDPYKDLIKLFYFDGMSREAVAEYFDTSVTTISRNKSRLINKLKTVLFSDDFILELYS